MSPKSKSAKDGKMTKKSNVGKANVPTPKATSTTQPSYSKIADTVSKKAQVAAALEPSKPTVTVADVKRSFPIVLQEFLKKQTFKVDPTLPAYDRLDLLAKFYRWSQATRTKHVNRLFAAALPHGNKAMTQRTRDAIGDEVFQILQDKQNRVHLEGGKFDELLSRWNKDFNLNLDDGIKRALSQGNVYPIITTNVSSTSKATPDGKKSVAANKASSKTKKPVAANKGTPKTQQAVAAGKAPKEPKKLPSQSALQLQDSRFLDRFPGFTSDPTAGLLDEFDRLAIQEKWSKSSKAYRRRRGEYLKDQFEDDWSEIAYTPNGSDDDDDYGGIDISKAIKLAQWQDLCHEVGIEPIPSTITKCRKALEKVHINIVDLLEARHANMLVESGAPGQRVTIKRFETSKALSRYTRNTEKYFPKDQAKRQGALRALLEHILS